MYLKNLYLHRENHKGLWLVVWIGRIVRRDLDKYYANVWLRRISLDVKDNMYNVKEYLEGETIKRELHVGVLNVVTIGCVINNKNYLVDTPDRYIDYYQKFYVKNPLSVDCVINNELKYNDFAFHIPVNADENSFYYFRFSFNKDFKKGKGPEKVIGIIPTPEVGRYFYFNQSEFIKPIITGLLNELYYDDYPIFVNESKRKVAGLLVDEGYTKKQLLELAFILYSHRGKKAISYIGNSIRYNLVNKGVNASYFKTYFPFRCNFNINTYGKFFNFNGVKYYLAYKIVGGDCEDSTESKPFHELIVDYKAQRTSTSNRNEKDNVNVSHLKLIPNYDDCLEEIGDDEGNSLLGIKNIVIENSPINKSFFNSDGVRISKIKRNDQKKRYNAHSKEKEINVESYTTELNGSNLGSAQKANISSDNETTGFLSYPFFDYIEKILEKLTMVEEINIIRVNSSSLDGNKYSRFPFTPNEFLYIKTRYKDHDEENRKKIRRALIAQLRVKNKFLYIIEVERRFGNFTTPIIHATDFSMLTESELKNVLAECAGYNGSWFRMVQDSIFEDVLKLKNPHRFEHQAKGMEDVDNMISKAVRKFDEVIRIILKDADEQKEADSHL